MKSFELASPFCKNLPSEFVSYLKSIDRKHIAAIGFLLVLTGFYVSGPVLELWDDSLEDTSFALKNYGSQLESNLNSTVKDTLVLQKERGQLLKHIEEKLVGYLYRIPDYSYVPPLEPYLAYAPRILDQIPSTVPLEKGDYRLSGEYGIRKHPISNKKKKHFGIDLAAAPDKHVYASASGTVVSVTYSRSGYGTHIVIKHRFGFRTLYGHLNQVLVSKGQTIEQHELIGTVGTSGSSTGYHLHYEVIKNGVRIDPMYSLQFKKKIYERLYQKPGQYGTEEKKLPQLAKEGQ